jgi:hypothetical protein
MQHFSTRRIQIVSTIHHSYLLFMKEEIQNKVRLPRKSSSRSQCRCNPSNSMFQPIIRSLRISMPKCRLRERQSIHWTRQLRLRETTMLTSFLRPIIKPLEILTSKQRPHTPWLNSNSLIWTVRTSIKYLRPRKVFRKSSCFMISGLHQMLSLTHSYQVRLSMPKSRFSLNS